MADGEPIDTTPQLSDTDSSDDESLNDPVETLVAGRERRTTAGNRYDRDMVLEEVNEGEDPDEVTLLFADNEEEAEDEEFKSDAEVDDADMSSSDDDDQGPNAAVDDMEGENEIHKQAKQERSKKRKADLALTSVAGMRKRLKTNPTRPMTSTPAKPSKKKERVTWVHDQDSGRSSLRKQTIAHRAETIARLRQSEAQSKKLKALKEKRDRERAREVPKQLTQADRLAEAARIERQNAKSLNRWEAMEKKRQEEQAAKLAALKNRKLEGPVITWLSQKVKWYGQESSKIATREATELTGPKKRGRKSKAELEQIAAGKVAVSTASASGPATASTTDLPLPTTENEGHPKTQSAAQEAVPSQELASLPTSIPPPSTGEEPQVPATQPSAEESDSFLRGIHEYAGLQVDSNTTPAARDPNPQLDADMESSEREALSQPEARPYTDEKPLDFQEAPIQPAHPPDGDKFRHPTEANTPNPARTDESNEPTKVKPEATPDQTNLIPLAEERQPTLDPDFAAAPPPPRIEEDSTRNLLILEKLDELSSDGRQQHSFFYNKKAARANTRTVKNSQELCPITTLPVRYRDPSTGIGYANAHAYKQLQELKDHRYAWSSMLGCYVGRGDGSAARGVPEGWT